jgi:hypothetical protein
MKLTLPTEEALEISVYRIVKDKVKFLLVLESGEHLDDVSIPELGQHDSLIGYFMELSCL